MAPTPLLGRFRELGSGFEIFSIGNKNLVHYVPTELNKDHNEILEMVEVSFEKLVVLKFKRRSNCIK